MSAIYVILGIIIGMLCILLGIIISNMLIKAHKEYIRKLAMRKYKKNYEYNKKIYQDYVKRKKENK